MRGLGAWSGVEPYLYLSPSFSRIVLLRAYVPFGVTTFNFFVVLFCFVLLIADKCYYAWPREKITSCKVPAVAALTVLNGAKVSKGDGLP